jgi:Zn finger protein HypA/HybF involved in hydrogenase expression
LPFGFGSVKLVSLFGHEARAVKVFMAEGYCVKCKAKREIANGVEETMKNGRKAIKGKCPTCGTVMFKILGGKAAAPAAAPVAPAPVNPPTS